MPHDVSAQDAELDGLGEVPADLSRLVTEYAGKLPKDLKAVDAMLDALGTRHDGRASAPEPVAPDPETPGEVDADANRDPQSGEVSLGDQDAHADVDQSGPGHRSGELPVTGDVSGSFQLPGAAPDDGAADDPSGAMQDALSSQLPGGVEGQGGGSEAQSSADASARPAVPDDSLTAAMVSDFEPPEVTQIVPTESRAPASLDDAEFEVEAPQPPKDAADDEFDALFEGLTSASEMPPPHEDGETGLVTQSRPIQWAREAVEAYVPDAQAEEFDDGEATKAFSAAAHDAAQDSAGAQRSHSLVEDIDLEELDSGELELVLDEDHSSAGDREEGGSSEDDDDSPDDGGSRPGGLLGRFLGRKK